MFLKLPEKVRRTVLQHHQTLLDYYEKLSNAGIIVVPYNTNQQVAGELITPEDNSFTMVYLDTADKQGVAKTDKQGVAKFAEIARKNPGNKYFLVEPAGTSWDVEDYTCRLLPEDGFRRGIGFYAKEKEGRKPYRQYTNFGSLAMYENSDDHENNALLSPELLPHTLQVP